MQGRILTPLHPPVFTQTLFALLTVKDQVTILPPSWTPFPLHGCIYTRGALLSVQGTGPPRLSAIPRPALNPFCIADCTG